MATFSISDIKSFKDCRQRWDFNSTARMSLQPSTPRVYFAVGSAYHAALEANSMGVGDPMTVFRDTLAEEAGDDNMHDDVYVEEIETAEALIPAYISWNRRTPLGKAQFLAVENRMEVELPNGHTFSFKFDGLAIVDGKTYIVEYKTTRQLPRETDWLELDEQAMAYQWATEKVLERPIYGTIYTWIRKKKPTVPKSLLRGGVSKSKNIVTTTQTYYDAVVAAGEDPSEYAEILKHIASLEAFNFFHREVIVMGEDQRRFIADHIYRMTTLMGDPNVDIYYAPSRMKCSGCLFKEPCTTLTYGRQKEVERMLADDYVVGSYY